MRLLPAALALGLLAAHSPLLACICFSGSTKAAYQRADAVFLASVVSYEQPRAVLRLIRTYKGHVPPVVEVFTGPDAGSCGYGSYLGKESTHLVYASAESEGLSISICDRTRPVDHAACDLAILDNSFRRWWWRTPPARFTPIRWLQLVGLRVPGRWTCQPGKTRA